MVALMVRDKETGIVLPLDVRPTMGSLILLAQLAESQGMEPYFQIGILAEEVIDEDIHTVPVL